MHEGVKTGFYKLNSKALNFKIDKDMEKILFNHYIMQKENFQRLKDDLPRGQFYISVRNVSRDLKIPYAKAQRLINKFIDLGIIKCVFKSINGSAKGSIFEYTSCANCESDTANYESDTANDINSDNDKASVFNGFNNINDNEGHKNDKKSDTVNDTASDTEKHSNFNGLKGASDTASDTVNDTSKKELIKKNYKKSIYSANDVEELWSLYPNKKGKAQAVKKIPKLLKLHGKEQLIRCIERYSGEVQDKDKQYILNGSTFFNDRYIDYLDSNYKEPEEKKKRTAEEVARELF